MDKNANQGAQMGVKRHAIDITLNAQYVNQVSIMIPAIRCAHFQAAMNVYNPLEYVHLVKQANTASTVTKTVGTVSQ